jgi:CBS domain-containing protein
MSKCSQVMTQGPSCCLASDTVEIAVRLMKDEDVGSVPVIANRETKKLVGIVTDRDIALKVVAEGQDRKDIHVEDVMTRNPVAFHADDDLQKALAAMAKHQVRRIPIVDDRNQVVGIISQSDVATRVQKPEKTAELVKEISKPGAKSKRA